MFWFIRSSQKHTFVPYMYDYNIVIKYNYVFLIKSINLKYYSQQWAFGMLFYFQLKMKSVIVIATSIFFLTMIPNAFPSEEQSRDVLKSLYSFWQTDCRGSNIAQLGKKTNKHIGPFSSFWVTVKILEYGVQACQQHGYAPIISEIGNSSGSY